MEQTLDVRGRNFAHPSSDTGSPRAYRTFGGGKTSRSNDLVG